MADVLTPSQRHLCMSRIRGKDTKPEFALRRALWSAGLRYRLGYKLPGKPDLVFVSARVAVFVDGCFWHGCPVHSTWPRNNAEFWAVKLTRNIERDEEVNRILVELGWTVHRVWEHQLRESLDDVVVRICTLVRHAGQHHAVTPDQQA